MSTHYVLLRHFRKMLLRVSTRDRILLSLMYSWLHSRTTSFWSRPASASAVCVVLLAFSWDNSALSFSICGRESGKTSRGWEGHSPHRDIRAGDGRATVHTGTYEQGMGGPQSTQGHTSRGREGHSPHRDIRAGDGRATVHTGTYEQGMGGPQSTQGHTSRGWEGHSPHRDILGDNYALSDAVEADGHSFKCQ